MLCLLVSCAAQGVSGFRIAYDQRNLDSSNQVLFSDQRVVADKMEYSIQVASNSEPRPFATDVHQMAYVRDFGRVGICGADGTDAGQELSNQLALKTG